MKIIFAPSPAEAPSAVHVHDVKKVHKMIKINKK